MRAGRLNERITIQSATVAKDSSNEAIETWSTYADVWANVETMDGKESFENDQLSTEYRVKFTIRARSGVTAAMRISYRSETYYITSVSPYTPRKDTVIIAHAAD